MRAERIDTAVRRAEILSLPGRRAGGAGRRMTGGEDNVGFRGPLPVSGGVRVTFTFPCQGDVHF
ncbi:hypothetical protein DMP11_04930 [Parvibacter caecicola]|nr:hypothetical protein DMP11_04930 [Parvibacter caecicola]